MAKVTAGDLLETFREMTLIELADFVKQFETQFGVTAAVAAAPALTVPAAEEPEIEEQAECDVILGTAGPQKVQVIKAVRGLTRLGLKDAKDLVDAAPARILAAVSNADAEAARLMLTAVGATVEVR